MRIGERGHAADNRIYRERIRDGPPTAAAHDVGSQQLQECTMPLAMNQRCNRRRTSITPQPVMMRAVTMPAAKPANAAMNGCREDQRGGVRSTLRARACAYDVNNPPYSVDAAEPRNPCGRMASNEATAQSGAKPLPHQSAEGQPATRGDALLCSAEPSTSPATGPADRDERAPAQATASVTGEIEAGADATRPQMSEGMSDEAR